MLRLRFLRSSGPGGQNVNKVETAVELRYDIRASGLPDDVKTRLRTLAGNRVTIDDVLVIVAREHRTQKRNRDAVFARLDALLAQAKRVPKRRRATKPSRSARDARMTEKRRRGVVKQLRGRGGDE